MSIGRSRRLNQRGIATVMVGLLLLLFVACIGLAVDLGRVYIVRSALSTAVDGAALAAARMIAQSTGAARTAATNTFNANFPSGFLGTSSVTSDIQISTAADGSDLLTVTGSASLPTLFMHLGGVGSGSSDVASSGQATRRLVDMAFVIDRSGSLGGAFPAVKTASANFIGLFDKNNDRVALISFSTNTRVHDPIRIGSRGFDMSTIQNDIANLGNPNGSTATAEGLYQAWDQLRLIPRDSQSGLRVVVLFTDGTPNSWPGKFQRVATSCGNGNGACVPSGSWVPYPPGVTGTLVTSDWFAAGDPTAVVGLNKTDDISFSAYVSPTDTPAGRWTSGTSTTLRTVVNPGIPELPNPAVSTHTPLYGSAGIPTNFLLYDSTLPHQRPMIGTLPYPNHVQNANNAARNLMESVANAIRADTSGRARIHIFALGLGADLTLGSGSDAETGNSMLMRTANDPASPDYISIQPDGGYFYAGDVTELAAAFEAIRDRIIRISE